MPELLGFLADTEDEGIDRLGDDRKVGAGCHFGYRLRIVEVNRQENGSLGRFFFRLTLPPHKWLHIVRGYDPKFEAHLE